jgi:hypothetical protein
MIVFCLSIHHIGGRTLAKHNQDACAVAYADNCYIKANLSVALEVLSDISLVLKADAGLDLNDKTKILVKGISATEAHAAAQRLLAADPSLAHIGPLLSYKTFVVDCCIGLGVPIGTDTFVQHFVKAKCRKLWMTLTSLTTTSKIASSTASSSAVARPHDFSTLTARSGSRTSRCSNNSTSTIRSPMRS